MQPLCMQRSALAGDDAEAMQAADDEEEGEDGVWLEVVPAAVLSRIRVPLKTRTPHVLHASAHHAVETGTYVKAISLVQRIQSPDALVDFFSDVAATLTSNTSMPPGSEHRTGAEVNSALGTALRRALLAFDALPFEVRLHVASAVQVATTRDCSPLQMQVQSVSMYIIAQRCPPDRRACAHCLAPFRTSSTASRQRLCRSACHLLSSPGQSSAANTAQTLIHPKLASLRRSAVDRCHCESFTPLSSGVACCNDALSARRARDDDVQLIVVLRIPAVNSHLSAI